MWGLLVAVRLKRGRTRRLFLPLLATARLLAVALLLERAVLCGVVGAQVPLARVAVALGVALPGRAVSLWAV